jgi:bacteriocin biosynthesis cyclodehydratase domain-containing protein
VKESDRLELAIAPTVICEPDLVRIIAGEDFRFTLRASGLDTWLPGILQRLDGTSTVETLLRGLEPARRREALDLLERLVSERLLFSAESLPEAYEAVLHAEGSGRLLECVQRLQPRSSAPRRVRALCQDTLDYRAALRFNEACRSGSEPWLWATLGPSARAFVSPIFWPDVGPCIACLLGSFERLSPAPELYGALIAHGERGGTFAAASFPENGLAVVGHLLHWKVAILGTPEPPASVSRLHVIEAAALEIATHRIPRDVECSVCHGDAEAETR